MNYGPYRIANLFICISYALDYNILYFLVYAKLVKNLKGMLL